MRHYWHGCRLVSFSNTVLSLHVSGDFQTCTTFFSKANGDFSCVNVDKDNAKCDCRGLPGGPPVLVRALEPPTSSVDLDKGLNDLNESKRCTPGQYACEIGHRRILVCNSQGNWQLSASCGSGTSCQTGLHHEAYCVVTVKGSVESTDLPPRSQYIATADEHTLASEIGTPHMESREKTATCSFCRLGGRKCLFTGSILCSGFLNCPEGADNIQDCPMTEATMDGQDDSHATLPARSLFAATPIADKQTSYVRVPRSQVNGPSIGCAPGELDCPCHPGEYTCCDDRDDICVCNSLGHWKLSAYCGEGVTCSEPVLGHPYCTGRSRAIPDGQEPPHPALPVRSLSTANPTVATPISDVPAPDPPNNEANRECTPGVYRCTNLNSTIVVCNSLGQWQLSADCGGYRLCAIGANGLPYCITGRQGSSGKSDSLEATAGPN